MGNDRDTLAMLSLSAARENISVVVIECLAAQRQCRLFDELAAKPMPSGLPRRCQYIAGKPSADDACKCRRPTKQGSSYCPRHSELCQQTEEAA